MSLGATPTSMVLREARGSNWEEVAVVVDDDVLVASDPGDERDTALEIVQSQLRPLTQHNKWL